MREREREREREGGRERDQDYTGLQIRVLNYKIFSYFSTKTCLVGTQKNRLDETVHLSTQNT